MKSISAFSQNFLKKYGIHNQQDFYFIILISGILYLSCALITTYVNLDIHQLSVFKADLISLNFAMPCLGALLSTFFFPKIREHFLLKHRLHVSLITLFISFGLMIFLINTSYDFPLRFIIGFFFWLLFLEIACFEAEIFQPPYRATFFSLMGIEVALSRALGAACVDFLQSPLMVFGACMVGNGICYFLILKWKTISKDKQNKTVTHSHTSSGSFSRIVLMAPLIFMSIFLMSSIGGAFRSYLAIFFEGTGLNEGNAALAYSFTSLGALILMPIAGRIGDKWGYEITFLLTVCMGLFASILSFFFKEEHILLFLFFIIRGAKQAFIFLMYGWFATQCSGKNLSYGMASFSLIRSSSYFLAPLSVGALINFYGNTSLLWWTLGCLSLTFIFMIFQMKQAKS
ncbi:MAG: hypothetical protein JSS34_01215 [Proteobacteria bacterium]|nr:hypothetical protein [Pseudomonadota bacterium]